MIYRWDKYLLLAFLGLLGFGIVMVASASFDIAEKQFGQPFYFLIRHGVYVVLGLAVVFMMTLIDLKHWEKLSTGLLLISLGLLLIVLVPGIGRTINGNTRWLGVGSFSLQASEVVKFFSVLYLSSYLVRHHREVQTQVLGFLKPLGIFLLIASLLLMEPDFGAAVVIMAMAMGVMFMAGLPIRHFIWLIVLMVGAASALVIFEPYRLARLTTFLNPWAAPFDSGYQLTQALIAFGRGEWFGLGLGGSVQKLFYLPEAHTDFVFAVLAEELGLLGVVVVLGLYSLLVTRLMIIARKAEGQQQWFHAYCVYGAAFCLGLQILINVGVNTGLLPTKGLTLPLLSYGGNSLIVTCLLVGLGLRAAFELKYES